MDKFRFSVPMPLITISNKLAFVLINGEIEKIPVRNVDGKITDETILEYVYDGVKLYNILSINDVLPRLREYVINNISVFDNSSDVNSCTIDNLVLWLDKDTRLTLRLRFAAEKASGITSTTLWYGTYKFTLSVNKALNILNDIEIYACKCYDITAAHKATVLSMTDIKDILSYDFKSGYPDKLSFTTNE